MPGAPVPHWAPPRQLDAVEALKYGWTAFTRNLGPYLLLAFVILALSIAISVGGSLIDGGLDNLLGETEPSANPFAVTLTPATTVANMVTTVIGSIVSVGMLRLSFDVLDGRKAELGRLFEGYAVGTAIIVAIIVSILTSVGTMLCILPGLAAALFLIFATAHVVDSGAGVGDALTGSARLVWANLGPVLLWALLLVVVGVVAVCCTLGLGLLVVGPVFSLSSAYAYRVLTGGAVSAPA